MPKLTPTQPPFHRLFASGESPFPSVSLGKGVVSLAKQKKDMAAHFWIMPQ